MKMTTGELIDRYTIEARKALYGNHDLELLHAIESSLTERFGTDSAKVIFAAAHLGVVNNSIAVLEWQLREGQNIPLEEMGRRSVIIRKLNARRVQHKNALSKFFGEPESALCFGVISESEVGMVSPQEPPDPDKPRE